MSQATVAPFCDGMEKLMLTPSEAIKNDILVSIHDHAPHFEPEHTGSELFDVALRRFIAACVAKQHAQKTFIDALDAVIKAALTDAVVHKNCSSLKKIADTLEKYGHTENYVKKVCNQIVAYVQDALFLPERSIAFSSEGKRFACRTLAFKSFLADIQEEGMTFEQYIHQCQNFSDWLTSQTAKKKQKLVSGQDKLNKAFASVIRIFDEYLLNNEDEELEKIRIAIAGYIESHKK